MVTEEIANSKDLITLAKSKKSCFNSYQWRLNVAKQIAAYLKKLHSRRFTHSDLNWRNILITQDEQPAVYFFDIPCGRKRFLSFKHFAIKDLAYLDKRGKKYLSKTFRLRFYMLYQGIKKLSEADKKIIRRSLKFFQHRQYN